MKKLYTKPSIEVKEYEIEENITVSSFFGADILDDEDAYDWEWVD